VAYSLKFLWRLFALWIVFFTLQRVLFYIQYSSDIDVGIGELLSMPFHAFKLDISGFSYLMGIPFVCISFLVLFRGRPRRVFLKIIHAIIWFLTLVYTIIFTSELVSYVEWRSKLSSKIFVHLETPSEIFRTSSGNFTGTFILYLILQLAIFYILYRVLILKIKQAEVQRPFIQKLPRFVAILLGGAFLLGMGLRGGLQQIPVSATSAYYSKSQIVNDMSVNSIWSFIHMTFQHFKKDIEGLYNQLDENVIKRETDELFNYQKNDSIKIFETTRPNIIFVTLESWSADMIGALSDEKGITPNFDRLADNGLLFTNLYANSTTSETGHSSIFSGYPTVPGISITSESAKCRQLPSLFKALQKEAYTSAYYFGGDLSYGNLGGYLSEMGVDFSQDENDLNLEPAGKLGIHDEAMFPYFFDEINAAKRPYIYCLFTQSTHAPYDIPKPYVKGYPKDSEGYVTSLMYADSVINAFIEQVKTLPDFENTIVVFVADHSKTHFKNKSIYSDQFYRIPLLFWGGALKQDLKGQRIHKIGSQSDIAKTLLNQMELSTEDFHWSKNLLDPNAPEWALMTTTMSFGIKDTSGYTCYNNILDKVMQTSYKNEIETQASLLQSRALVEAIYREFRAF